MPTVRSEDRDGGLRLLTLDRPPANGIDLDLLADLSAGLDAARDDDAVRAFVLGSGITDEQMDSAAGAPPGRRAAASVFLWSVLPRWLRQAGAHQVDEVVAVEALPRRLADAAHAVLEALERIAAALDVRPVG